MASLCLYEPLLVVKKDCSLQSIFQLTRAEVRAMVRRGYAMTREERLLA